MILNEDNWFLVQSKVAGEARALTHLERQGYRCYLPLACNPTRRRRAVRRAQPLFARYLFVAVEQHQALAPIDATQGVTRLVRFGVEPARVPAAVIGGLKAATNADSGLVELIAPTIEVGDEVEVFAGPLDGLRGIFQACDGAHRAWLLVELLGQAQQLSLPIANLRVAR